MIRVLLVDDHAAFRQPLAFMINREEDMEVEAEAGTVADARQVLAGADLGVIDLNLPDGSGVELVRDFRLANHRGRVLVLTGTGIRKEQALAVEAGAAMVMHKSAGIPEIVDTIRRLSAGEDVMPPARAIELLRFATEQRERDRDAQLALRQLTPREREVLAALTEGLSDRDIAQRLHVSTETVRTHMVNIFSKLQVDSRLQALVFAVRHGAVTIE
ncbi:MAG: response regulator transcription factor [Chloroflexi bacterium]|nr:response regulator transcription factor [Chloroflexota bacterium]